HAGAIAALVKSANLSATPAQIRTFLINSAIDIETGGVDRNSGAGIIMADTAVAAAVPCTFSLNATSASFTAAAAIGSVQVTTQSSCNWTAASNSPFLTITGGSSGTGTGTVSYSAATNAGAANQVTADRSGTLTIAAQTYSVFQSGCSFPI